MNGLETFFAPKCAGKRFLNNVFRVRRIPDQEAAKR